MGRPIPRQIGWPDLTQGLKLRVGVFANESEKLVEGAAFRAGPDRQTGRCDSRDPAPPRNFRSLGTGRGPAGQ